ncbi:MAG: NADH-quinone oxidoreductase subunit M [Acidimicrobiia bacterium]|nr:NADH-quinone oxidoreductase subunit M [Acidimicrobiia bacterium]
MTFQVLDALILTPIAAAIVIALVPNRRAELHLPLGITLSMVPLALAGWLFFAFDKGVSEYQFVHDSPWYEPWGMSWHVGVDGISLALIALTALLVPISLAASTAIKDRTKLFVVFMLLLEAGLIGVFVSLDLILFFLFFEVVLVPMYFIIGVWGGERRIYAAYKFFIYTALGSALMLAGIIALAFFHRDQTGVLSFGYQELLNLELTDTAQLWLFGAFGLAFAIKVPIFPLHTWLPDAHVEAPTAGSVMLAGVLLKLGTYGFIRFNLGLFPDATIELIPVMATLAVIGILYGAYVAIVQPDLKKLVAYSSVSHLGFIILGTFALTQAAVEGAVIQMVNHGITTGVLFLMVGMLYERRHTKMIADFGGIWQVAPWFSGVFLFTAFASIGLPGLNGFVGEFMVLMGSYSTLPVAAIFGAFGVVLAAIYLLWAYERVFTGPITIEENREVADLNVREVTLLAPLIALMLVLGLYPNIILDRVTPSVEAVLDRVEATTTYEVPEPGPLAEVLGGGHGD